MITAVDGGHSYAAGVSKHPPAGPFLSGEVEQQRESGGECGRHVCAWEDTGVNSSAADDPQIEAAHRGDDGGNEIGEQNAWRIGWEEREHCVGQQGSRQIDGQHATGGIAAAGRVDHPHHDEAGSVYEEVAEFEIQGQWPARRLDCAPEAVVAEKRAIDGLPAGLERMSRMRPREPVHLAVGDDDQSERNPVPRDAVAVDANEQGNQCCHRHKHQDRPNHVRQAHDTGQRRRVYEVAEENDLRRAQRAGVFQLARIAPCANAWRTRRSSLRGCAVFFLMIRKPPRSCRTASPRSSMASGYTPCSTTTTTGMGTLPSGFLPLPAFKRIWSRRGRASSSGRLTWACVAGSVSS